MRNCILVGLIAFLILPVWGCGESQPKAKVTLINAQSQKVGEAQLEETPQGVRITLKAENLPPGPHAFHIHEKGLCDPPDFMTAGGHFNPFHKKHGMKNPEGPHVGDLPNLVVGTDGKDTIEVITSGVTLKPGQNSLFPPGGTSLVIHAGPDDYMTDPAGNAGPSIACGVITKQ